MRSRVAKKISLSRLLRCPFCFYILISILICNNHHTTNERTTILFFLLFFSQSLIPYCIRIPNSTSTIHTQHTRLDSESAEWIIMPWASRTPRPPSISSQEGSRRPSSLTHPLQRCPISTNLKSLKLPSRLLHWAMCLMSGQLTVKEMSNLE